jgi:hypothetical protein
MQCPALGIDVQAYDADKRHDLSALRMILLSGSPAQPESFSWFYAAVKRGDDLIDGLSAIEILAVEAIAVRCEQQLGLDLGETVDHCGGAELRCGGGPNRPDRYRRQQCHDRLGSIGQIGRNPIAGSDAEDPHGGCQAPHAS